MQIAQIVTIPLQGAVDDRQSERFHVAMPLTLNGQTCATLDLSATGLSFEADRPYNVGVKMDLTIDYLMDGHNFPLQCQAVVVRVEPKGTRFIIGARLVAPFFEAA